MSRGEGGWATMDADDETDLSKAQRRGQALDSSHPRSVAPRCGSNRQPARWIIK